MRPSRATGGARETAPARPRGALGSGFIGGAAEAIDELKRYVAIPAEFTPSGIMPLGRPLPDVRSPSLRRGRDPFEDFARWETWHDRPGS